MNYLTTIFLSSEIQPRRYQIIDEINDLINTIKQNIYFENTDEKNKLAVLLVEWNTFPLTASDAPPDDDVIEILESGRDILFCL